MRNKRALLLCSVMMRGYGVSIVAEELARRMPQFGWDLYIGTTRADGNFAATPTFLMNPDAQEILKFCDDWNIEVVIAQTTPYFEVLPHLADHIPVVVYEHGDPTPSFFTGDSEERERIRQNKIQNVYPVVNKVLASSHFLVQDIGWPKAEVLTLGCNHVPDFGLKPSNTILGTNRSLRVGSLMRLGAGEAQYKGNAIFGEIVAKLRADNDDINFFVMGRGTEADGDEWRKIGVTPILNAPDAGKVEYLRGLDIFVSPSMWEGFNLPIVEAQALGTVGIGFDAGAHPETALHLAKSTDDAISMIEHWSIDRKHLALACNRAYEYVRTQFDWDSTAQGMVAHCEAISSGTPLKWVATEETSIRENVVSAERRPGGGFFNKVIRVWRREGLTGSLRLIKKRMRGT